MQFAFINIYQYKIASPKQEQQDKELYIKTFLTIMIHIDFYHLACHDTSQKITYLLRRAAMMSYWVPLLSLLTSRFFLPVGFFLGSLLAVASCPPPAATFSDSCPCVPRNEFFIRYQTLQKKNDMKDLSRLYFASD